jgi:hypothetical protein
LTVAFPLPLSVVDVSGKDAPAVAAPIIPVSVVCAPDVFPPLVYSPVAAAAFELPLFCGVSSTASE